MSELESLATEVIQEAQVSTSYCCFDCCFLTHNYCLFCHQVNQSEISFEIREEDVGANCQKRRSDDGLVSLKEKNMRLVLHIVIVIVHC